MFKRKNNWFKMGRPTQMTVNILTTLGALTALTGTIAAVISAIPVIKRWRLPQISDKESKVLRLGVSENSYPYTILFVCGIAKPYVETPFQHKTKVVVSDEVATLLEKELIHILQTETRRDHTLGNYTFIWLMLTQRGLQVMNKLSTKKN
ncbi:hypothetical protein [Vibrio parahaemolyticus]|uniref:hypothetical protein n=1 Tax=Vibrio parahaemolyticus TaxID=670 RepID=UPI0015DE6BDE|nr:hypothetical protein [Vibrio parahaemolyticus]